MIFKFHKNMLLSEGGGGGATTRTGVSFSLTRARGGVGAAPGVEFLGRDGPSSPPARRGALFAKSMKFSDFLRKLWNSPNFSDFSRKGTPESVKYH